MPNVLLQRDAEMAEVSRRLGDVRAGTGQVILVEGPAGIGKSSLLAATARAAAANGDRVLRAWGGPLERDAGWGIARQLFAPVRGADDWPELATGAAALATRALDAGGGTPPAPSGDIGGDTAAPAGDAMHAAAHGLVWLACGLAERGPVLLVVDDVHWADAPSLRWLVQLARQIGELRLAVLCAVRTGEPPASPSLLAELLAETGPAVRPAPLGPSAVESMVAGRMPGAGAGFVAACHAASGGNPFLLGALLDHLVAERAEPCDETAARLGSFGPEQVARVVDRQLSRLPSGAAELARAFAVLGREAPLRHAAELARIPADDAAGIADRLRAAGLAGAPGAGPSGNPHPLVASALYQGIPAGERALLHKKAAAVLVRERADPEAVALHLVRSDPAREAATVAALCAAAGQAERRGAPETAAVFLRRALAEPPPEAADEADIRCRLGLILAAQALPDAASLLDAAVADATTDGQRARLALAAGRALGLAGYFDDAARLCRRGLEAPGADPDVLDRLEAELIGNSWLHAGSIAEARERLRRRSGERPDGPDGSGPLWRVLEAWDAMSGCRATGDIPVVDDDSILATVAKFVLITTGDLDTARERCTALIETARPRGWRIAHAHGSFLRALALVEAGRVHEAETDARIAFDFKRLNSPPQALIWSAFPLIEALVEGDELEAADEVARAIGDPPEGVLAGAFLLERRARLRLAQHRPAEAHADLTAAAATWKALDMNHPGAAAWRVDDCLALVALGEVTAARRLAEEHLRLAEKIDRTSAHAAGLRALAATGDDPIPTLTTAASMVRNGPYRLEHTRIMVELGAALRRANHRAAAREPLGRALALADRGGMRLLARRCRDELRAAGARPRGTPDSLTAAEHRVAVLAARGLSNREIAQQLYVTRRTVETHLTHVFQKIGGGRADLRGLVGCDGE